MRSGKNAYEVEHILADKFDMFTEEFEDAAAFEEWRNYIGGLLLLPKKVNASLGSGLIDQIQKMMVAAMQIAEKKVCAHRS